MNLKEILLKLKSKKGIIILAAAVVLIIIAFFTKNYIISFFSNYSKNFKTNVSAIASLLDIKLPAGCQNAGGNNRNGQPMSAEEEAERQKEIDNSEYEATNVNHSGKNIALEYASSGRYSRYGDGILCATETALTFYSQSGENKWSESIQISSPVLEVADKYALIFEKNGKKLSVYNGEGIVFSKTVAGTIKRGAVSSGGDVTIVFEREGYKGSVMVYNKAGDEVYLWNSGKYSVMDADMSSSRKLAVTLLNTENTVQSKIYFFDIAKSDVESRIDLDDSIVFDIDFDGDTLNAFADDKIVGISSKAEIKWTYDAKNKNITNYVMTSGGTKVVSFDNNNASEIVLISAGGDEKGNIKSEVIPDIVDISNDRILYNEGRTLVLTGLSGEILSKYTCSRDIKNAYIINKDNIFIVYSSSIEFLNVKE